jgi:hypothetical protein
LAYRARGGTASSLAMMEGVFIAAGQMMTTTTKTITVDV